MENELVAYKDTYELAEKLVTSSLIPAHFKKPQDAWYALLRGKELGLSPIFSLENISVIKGKTALNADAMFAIARSNPEYGGCTIVDTNESCTITMRRISPRGFTDERTMTFTMDDAKTAGLLSNETYRKYPKRMLKHRCMAYVCRDLFADVLAAMYTEEELRDGADSSIVPEYEVIGDEIKHSPAPATSYTQAEVLALVKEAKDLMQTFSLVYSTKSKYDMRIATATKTLDGDTLKSVIEELKMRKDAAEKDSKQGRHEVAAEVKVEESPTPAEETQPVPEKATADEAKDEPVTVTKPTNNDNIIAVLKELFAIDDYPIAHKRNSLAKHLPSVFIAPESSDWESAVQNATIPVEEATKAIAYYKSCIPAAKKQKKEKQSKQPSWKAQAEAVLKLYPECQIATEMRQVFDDAESQPENGDAWQTIYEQAREFLNPAKEQANEAGN